MDDRRQFPRFDHRMQVRYTVLADEKVHIAFTCDVGAGGLSITSHKPEKHGTKLVLEVKLPDGRTAKLEGGVELQGDVRWSRAVSGGLHVIQRGSFGVRIHYASENWYQFIAGLAKE